MNALFTMLVLLSILFCAILLFVALMYNILVYRRNAADNVFSTIDVMLKKRYDLIPNLVETVKGYAAHEKETFTKISEMRAKAVSDSTGVNEKINLDG
ncbi:MAG: LemA family protein, partial [Lentisphaerota bacterium]